MRSGNLKNKVAFETYAETQNDFGEVIKGYSDFKTVYASIVPLSGKEYFSAQQINAEISHKIECRYFAGVLPTMRIVYGTRIFNIESVINIREANKTLQIMCTEVI